MSDDRLADLEARLARAEATCELVERLDNVKVMRAMDVQAARQVRLATVSNAALRGDYTDLLALPVGGLDFCAIMDGHASPQIVANAPADRQAMWLRYLLGDKRIECAILMHVLAGREIPKHVVLRSRVGSGDGRTDLLISEATAQELAGVGLGHRVRHDPRSLLFVPISFGTDGGLREVLRETAPAVLARIDPAFALNLEKGRTWLEPAGEQLDRDLFRDELRKSQAISAEVARALG